MEIPYTVSTRPDTGLWNAKVGIWLFLASEVMLFGGLFSAYIFLRLDAPPGMWPHGLLNVPVGTMNTAILILSSVTVVLAWAALKMRKYRAYWWYMLATILCGVIFLTVKLVYEWPQKFDHVSAHAQRVFCQLFHHHRFARNARARRCARLHLYVAAGQQKALPAQSRASRQPRRSLRPLLALCRSDLDFRLPAFLFALADEQPA